MQQMDDLDRHRHGPGNWIRIAANGVAVCLLAGVLLSLVLRFFFPKIVDARTVASKLYGIAIWLVSIGLGIWHARKRARAG
jgi:succinate dehydrogenase hydrophobic anchor subunit